ncbi:MAG: NADH-quinone oxidoreductase subunit N, partial [Alphaproteobacteria bacterium]
MIASDVMTALPELLLAGLAIVLLMYGVFRGNQATQSVLLLAVAGLVVVFAVLVLGPSAGGSAFGGLFVVDGFTAFMKALVLIGSAVTMIMSLRYFEREQALRFEYPVLMLFATLGMLMMVSAGDLMSLYVGLELQSLSLYVIAAFRRDSLRSTEAGLKYFVLGALSSGMLLYGASMIYGFAGTTSFQALASVFAEITSAGETPSLGIVVGLV